MKGDRPMPTKSKNTPPIDFAALTAIGSRMRRAREDAGLTTTEVARKRGHSPQWLSDIERGEANITFYEAAYLARIYETPIEMFVGPTVAPSSFRIPQSLTDWQAMYRGQPGRAHAHYDLDEVYNGVMQGKIKS